MVRIRESSATQSTRTTTAASPRASVPVRALLPCRARVLGDMAWSNKCCDSRCAKHGPTRVILGMPVLVRGVRSRGTDWAGHDAGAVYCTLITAKLVHQQLKVHQTPAAMLNKNPPLQCQDPNIVVHKDPLTSFQRSTSTTGMRWQPAMNITAHWLPDLAPACRVGALGAAACS